jgi:hypothetical protein
MPITGYWINEDITEGSIVVDCFPPDACPGGNLSTCAVCRTFFCPCLPLAHGLQRRTQTGYTGWACTACQADYWMLDRACVRCNDGAGLVSGALVVAGNVLVLVLLYRWVRAGPRDDYTMNSEPRSGM